MPTISLAFDAVDPKEGTIGVDPGLFVRDRALLSSERLRESPRQISGTVDRKLALAHGSHDGRHSREVRKVQNILLLNCPYTQRWSPKEVSPSHQASHHTYIKTLSPGRSLLVLRLILQVQKCLTLNTTLNYLQLIYYSLFILYLFIYFYSFYNLFILLFIIISKYIII